MMDYTKIMPEHIEKFIGENDLFLEVFNGEGNCGEGLKRPPLLFVHGAYSGSWMWSKYIPHFVREGWECFGMNMRSHYKSRTMDMTRITFEDYLEDIREIIEECSEAPIIIGHSMGGILGQKLAETVELAGLVLVDSSISKEVNSIAPYSESADINLRIIEPAPAKEQNKSKDESEEDIIFQRKYLTMESSKALQDFAFSFGAKEGISIDSSRISCPCLIISAVNSEDDDRRGRATADHLKGEYVPLWDTTHTGLLVGQRYMEVVESIMAWLKKL